MANKTNSYAVAASSPPDVPTELPPCPAWGYGLVKEVSGGDVVISRKND